MAVELLSVILPTADRSPQLAKQLDALARQQSTGPWELLVVDNGSTDDTPAVVASYADRLPVRLVTAADRRNVSYARNVGVEAARGDYLVFVDDDDLVTPGWLEAMRAAADRSAIIRGCDRYVHRGEDGVDEIGPDCEGLRYPFGLLPSLSCANSGLRTDLFRKVGGFDERYTRIADTHLFWRAQIESGEMPEFVADAILEYRLRSGMRAIWHQGYADSKEVPALFREFHALGMPRMPLANHLRGWKRVILHGPGWLRTYSGREQLATHLGWLLGRIVGSLRQRVFCL